MSELEVSYLPISEFNVPEASEKYERFKAEENKDDRLDLKNLSGKNIPEEVVLILIGMGMEKYIEVFQSLKLSLESFLNINESELEDIGITNEDDRKCIIKNLSYHRKKQNDFNIAENHIEDLTIIKNVSYQLLLLQNYCAYVELHLRKQTLIDYAVGPEENASKFLKAFAESALTQSQIISSRIHETDNSETLINKILKIYDLTLPKNLQDFQQKKSIKKIFLKVMVFVGFSSLVLLSGRYFLRRN